MTPGTAVQDAPPKFHLRLSEAMLVALAPRATYESLVAVRARGSWTRALGVPVLTLLVFAIAASVLASQGVSLVTTASLAACWAFIPGFQLLTAAMLCRRAPARLVSWPRALELFFLGHVPWSLWMTAIAFATLWIPPGRTLVNVIAASVLVPAIWTPFLVSAFCGTVLGCDRAEAHRRTGVHQAVTWTALLVYAVLSIQPWARFGGGP